MSTTFKATIEHVNHTTSRATVRTHAFLVDRGVPKGGFDLGPAGAENMLVLSAAVSQATCWRPVVPVRLS